MQVVGIGRAVAVENLQLQFAVRCAQDAAHQVIDAEGAVGKALQGRHALRRVAQQRAVGIHRQVDQEAGLHLAAVFLHQLELARHCCAAHARGRQHGVAAHRFGQHVVAKGAQIAAAEWLQVQHHAARRIGGQLRPDMEGWIAFGPHRSFQRGAGRAADVATVAHALHAGEVPLDVDAGDEFVPLCTADRGIGLEQCLRAAQRRLVLRQPAADALLDGGAVGGELLTRAALGADGQQVPDQHRQPDAGEQRSPLRQDAVLADVAQAMAFAGVGAQYHADYAAQHDEALQRDQRVVERTGGERPQAAGGAQHRTAGNQQAYQAGAAQAIAVGRPADHQHEQIGQPVHGRALGKALAEHGRDQRRQRQQRQRGFQQLRWPQLQRPSQAPRHHGRRHHQHASGIAHPPGGHHGPVGGRRNQLALQQGDAADAGADQAHDHRGDGELVDGVQLPQRLCATGKTLHQHRAGQRFQRIADRDSQRHRQDVAIHRQSVGAEGGHVGHEGAQQRAGPDAVAHQQHCAEGDAGRRPHRSGITLVEGQQQAGARGDVVAQRQQGDGHDGGPCGRRWRGRDRGWRHAGRNALARIRRRPCQGHGCGGLRWAACAHERGLVLSYGK